MIPASFHLWSPSKSLKILWTWLWLTNYYNTLSKHLLVFKTSWKRLQDMSWRRLQHVFSVTVLRYSLEDVLEDEKLLRSRRLQDVLKTLSWRRLEGISWDVFKTSWMQTKCLLVISVSNKSKCVSNKSMFHKTLSDKSKANPKCVS